ncbi:MAG: hypothetical protein ACOY0T_23405 [Myxococcota bacterium]
MVRNGSLFFACVASVALLASPARAQTAPTDGGSEVVAPKTEKPVVWLPWHHTFFLWDHAVSAQTLGIGRDYQSRNPTYEMMFRLAPRYYFIDDPTRSVSARADIRLIREFTNSDTTTDRGEWTFTDTEVWLAYVHALSKKKGSKTDFLLRLPSVLLPTSKNSWLSGRRLGLAAGIGVDQQVPLRGEGKALSGLMLRPRATYTYQFVNSPVATRSGFDRVRVDPEGRSLPSDQLSGSALPQHLLNLSLRIDTSILERVRTITEFGLRYSHRYALPQSVQIENVDTGPVTPEPAPSPTRWDVTTMFSMAVYYQVQHYLDIGIGYDNLSSQLGADGRRRGFFYSPDARVFLALFVVVDDFYQEMRGQKAPESHHTAGAAHRQRF